MLDAARGLAYLHSNGILHRDIKPDNVLVFSLGEVIGVNGKLMDFGSSRNINLLMTNMTFTKGIGTPTYMAPEVLNEEKYKKAADVFSFGVTVFKTFKLDDEDRKSAFKYRWDICAFIQCGKRPDAGNTQTTLGTFIATIIAVARFSLSAGRPNHQFNRSIRFHHHRPSRQASG